ncbi:hypothetical protein BHUM_03968 [Candidatus Burkholderia humilis]|nr:hypothetical protein BHUM_03968 [Candidatus Burkholderia humilis]
MDCRNGSGVILSGTNNYKGTGLEGPGAWLAVGSTNYQDANTISLHATNGIVLDGNVSITGNLTVAGNTSIEYFHANSTGADSTATGTDAVAVGTAANATGNNSVAIGAGSVADRDNSFSVSAAGAERQRSPMSRPARQTPTQ